MEKIIRGYFISLVPSPETLAKKTIGQLPAEKKDCICVKRPSKAASRQRHVTLSRANN